MSTYPSASVLLTVEDVERWRAERDVLQHKVATLNGQIENLTRKLDAAHIFMSEASTQALLLTADDGDGEDGGTTSMRMSIRQALSAAVNGLKYAELKERLCENPEFNQRLARNPQYIYTAVGRLAQKRQLIKHGNRIFAPELYATWLARKAQGAGNNDGAASAAPSEEIESGDKPLTRQGNGLDPLYHDRAEMAGGGT